MSRWIDNFNANPFHTQLENYQKIVNEFDEGEITNPEILTEFARLKKVLAHLEEILNLIDPELNSLNALKNPNDQLQASYNSFVAFTNSQENISQITQANNQLDVCVNVIKPLQTVIPTTTKKSLVSMLTAYDKAIQNALTNIDLPKVKKDSSEIQELKHQIIDSEDSTKSQIENAVTDIEEKHNEISATHDWLLTDGETENEKAIKTKIDTLYNYIVSTSDKADEIDTELDKLHKFYEKIFGKSAVTDDPETNSSNTKKTSGLKAELAERLTELDELKENHKEKYDRLIEDIESLLPNATNAGLAGHFNEERGKFSKPIKNWNNIFIGSLSVMLIVTLISFFNITLAPLGISYNGAENWDAALTEILHRLPLYGPLVWLAIYAGRRRSELQRLEQEYVHKEVFAKSYSSYKQQAEKLENNDPLIAQLLERSIDAIAHNASESLDRKQKDDTPLNELVKTLSELKSAIKNLKD